MPVTADRGDHGPAVGVVVHVPGCDRAVVVAPQDVGLAVGGQGAFSGFGALSLSCLPCRVAGISGRLLFGLQGDITSRLFL